MKSKNIGIILRYAPYGKQLSQEAIDAILAASVYGQTLTIILMADGVFQLMVGQDPNAIKQKSFQKQLAAFELYDIDNIFVCKQSLAERGLNKNKLLLSPTLLDKEEINQLIHQQDTILSF